MIEDNSEYTNGHVRKDEEQKPASVPDIKTNLTRLELICLGYKEWMTKSEKRKKKRRIIPIDIVSKFAPQPTKQEIEEFCLELKNNNNLGSYGDFHWITSNYLSALIAQSREDNFILSLDGLNLDCIGLGLKGKNIIVRGKAGKYVGNSAENCRIESDNFESLSKYIGKGTEIYCQGKRVWPK
ncbi:hypothetical protein HZA33_01385 [Candidatus Pacearchaeota archaeon]|nr:hypothetical protein [Candidatus Pacearchaeota archaeon]